MTIDEFIVELKPMVRFDRDDNKHYMGSTILTNQELNHMLHLMIDKKKYSYLSYTKRKKIRQKIFKEIQDGN